MYNTYIFETSVVEETLSSPIQLIGHVNICSALRYWTLLYFYDLLLICKFLGF
jgi:hypothetical protein